MFKRNEEMKMERNGKWTPPAVCAERKLWSQFNPQEVTMAMDLTAYLLHRPMPFTWNRDHGLGGPVPCLGGQCCQYFTTHFEFDQIFLLKFVFRRILDRVFWSRLSSNIQSMPVQPAHQLTPPISTVGFRPGAKAGSRPWPNHRRHPLRRAAQVPPAPHATGPVSVRRGQSTSLSVTRNLSNMLISVAHHLLFVAAETEYGDFEWNKPPGSPMVFFWFHSACCS